jgi:uncharacterized phage protein gp47/JayE
MAYSDAGYVVKPEEQWFEEIMASFKTAFPGMSERPSNMMVILSRILAKVENTRDYDRVEMYNQSALESATASYLDAVVSLGGIKRHEGTKGIGTITVAKKSGSANMIIPAKSYIKSGDILFFTRNEFTIITGDPTVQVDIESEEYTADANLPAGSTFMSIEILEGVDTMTLDADITTAKSEETDGDLRIRYELAVNTLHNSSLAGILGEVRKVEGVSMASGSENVTDTDDPVTGIPPHSFEVVVNGGTDNDVAQSIFNIKPAGIRSHGDVIVDIPFEGLIHQVAFSRFNLLPVFFTLTVVTDPNTVPPDIEAQVKLKIQEYIAEEEVIKWYELSSFLSQEIPSIEGISELFQGLTANPTDNLDLTKAFNEIFSSPDENIVVTIV